LLSDRTDAEEANPIETPVPEREEIELLLTKVGIGDEKK
jgi:hypothetical protein